MEINTIDDALKAYAAVVPAGINSDYRSVIEILLKQAPKEPISNHSFLDALILTDVMFRRTNNALRMLTGAGSDFFLTALRVPFEAALARIKQTKGKALIIVADTDHDDESGEYLRAIQANYPEVLKVAMGRAIRSIEHLIICDTTMVRIEEPHEPLTRTSSVDSIKAKVFLNNQVTAEGQSVYFDTIWKTLTAPQPQLAVR